MIRDAKGMLIYVVDIKDKTMIRPYNLPCGDISTRFTSQFDYTVVWKKFYTERKSLDRYSSVVGQNLLNAMYLLTLLLRLQRVKIIIDGDW